MERLTNILNLIAHVGVYIRIGLGRLERSTCVAGGQRDEVYNSASFSYRLVTLTYNRIFQSINKLGWFKIHLI